MNKWQAAVNEFHEAAGQTVGDRIAIRDRELRAKLIMEEAVETVAALGYSVEAAIFADDGIETFIAEWQKTYAEPHLVDFIDGMCDLIYVVAGSAVATGVDLDPHFEEVHRANMTKLSGPKREDGKQLKPEGWMPPDHEKHIIRAEQRAAEWDELEKRWTRT